MLLCDTLHLVGFKLYDRKKIEDDKKKEKQNRLLGFESKPKVRENREFELSEFSPAVVPIGKTLTSESPKKPKKEVYEPCSLEKYKIIKDKI